ncbi:MAG TPA: hypothetical protein VLL48_14185, partial [Longimicrobiales bacterium]|nr:hypothetical protein [Longimicrobiales bacterium]
MARLAPYVPALTALLTATAPLPVAAQEVEFERPSDWRVRLDDPGATSADDVYFVDMPPGWHVTTGPAAILWNPGTAVDGSYRVEMEVFLFDPESRREGFGLFVGGHDLDGPDRRYLYFLIREGGDF